MVVNKMNEKFMSLILDSEEILYINQENGYI